MTRLVAVPRGLSPSERVIGSKLPWTTLCDGMPTLRGCGQEIETTVPFKRPGRKTSGWLLTWAKDDDGTDDKSMLLAFCPSCAEHVLAYEKERG